jgi:predicted SnoaL-like aldol condensation-catalyzing enzyme
VTTALFVVHSRYEMAGAEWRFIDIYRVEDGKLAEHWTLSGETMWGVALSCPWRC